MSPVGTDPRGYRSFGESPVGSKARSYRTLIPTPAGYLFLYTSQLSTRTRQAHAIPTTNTIIDSNMQAGTLGTGTGHIAIIQAGNAEEVAPHVRNANPAMPYTTGATCGT